MSQERPANTDRRYAGPSARSIALTTTHNDTLPVTHGSGKLPFELRQVENITDSDVTVTIQSNGVVFAVVIPARGYYDRRYIQAMSGIVNSQLVGGD